MIKCDGCGTENPLGEGRPSGAASKWAVSLSGPEVTGHPTLHLCWDCLYDALYDITDRLWARKGINVSRDTSSNH